MEVTTQVGRDHPVDLKRVVFASDGSATTSISSPSCPSSSAAAPSSSASWAAPTWPSSGKAPAVAASGLVGQAAGLFSNLALTLRAGDVIKVGTGLIDLRLLSVSRGRATIRATLLADRLLLTTEPLEDSHELNLRGVSNGSTGARTTGATRSEMAHGHSALRSPHGRRAETAPAEGSHVGSVAKKNEAILIDGVIRVEVVTVTKAAVRVRLVAPGACTAARRAPVTPRVRRDGRQGRPRGGGGLPPDAGQAAGRRPERSSVSASRTRTGSGCCSSSMPRPERA